MKELTDFQRKVAEFCPNIRLQNNEPMAKHTSFRIGGEAEVMAFPCSIAEISQLLKVSRLLDRTPAILGAGTNVLAPDEGISGLVICLKDGMDGMERLCGNAIRVGAGVTLTRAAMFAAKQGLSGLEFAHGIPGTVGGGVYMNAGAYGGELKDVLESVTFLDDNLQLRTLPAADLAMGYRTSIFEQNPGWCILSVTVVLHRGDGAAVLAKMQELLGKRKEKQPLEWPSAGSTFKRPVGAFAGKLIEDCGLRGFTVGGAQISEKHCGFVINRGGATCADVVELTEQVKQIVKQKTGFVLEREIRVVK